jgi:S-adenosylmethionine synthetase
MRIYLAGRATTELEGVTLPVRELAEEAARTWLRANIHGLDVDRHVEIEPLLRPGSRDLVELFRRQSRRRNVLANDTSCGVGFAPFSRLERVVLAVERELTAGSTTRAHPWLGEDVKVMGVRTGEQIELTLACALIGRHLADMDAYAAAKEMVTAIAREVAAGLTDQPVTVAVNLADDPARGSVYLTVTGTSAEAGDDGQAGRGNRATGLITPYRPMVMESAPGKNPVSHTGKVYAVAAQMLAADLLRAIPEVTEARCLLLSRIGAPVTSPYLIDVGLRTLDDSGAEALRDHVERTAHQVLESLPGLWRAIETGAVSALDFGWSAER